MKRYQTCVRITSSPFGYEMKEVEMKRIECMFGIVLNVWTWIYLRKKIIRRESSSWIMNMSRGGKRRTKFTQSNLLVLIYSYRKRDVFDDAGKRKWKEEQSNLDSHTYICTVIGPLYRAKYRLKIYETSVYENSEGKKKTKVIFPLLFMRQKYQER